MVAHSVRVLFGSPATEAGRSMAHDAISMPKLFKKFDDPRLARKIAVLRTTSFLLGIAWTAFVLSQSIGGEMLAHGSSTGSSRSLSRTYIRTISWGEQPMMFALNLVWLVGIGVLCHHWVSPGTRRIH